MTTTATLVRGTTLVGVTKIYSVITYCSFYLIICSQFRIFLHTLESSYDTPLLGTCLWGGLYPASDAFFIASSASSAVINGVVLTTLTAPPAEKAIETATALMLSGIFTTNTTSYSPKENQPPCNFPPSLSIADFTTSIRFSGFANSAAEPSAVYVPCTK